MALRRAFGAARWGLAASAVVLLIAAVSCAAPTQIIVEVFTDACPGSGKPEVVQSTGIAVGTPENIESQRPTSTHDGCETATGIGTLTIYPSGEKTDEVALKVLGGVEVSPDRCDPPSYAGCIVDERTMRFVPHETQHVTVILSIACLNRQCPMGTTCQNGACVDPGDILADGGTTDDAETFEAAAVDAVADVSVTPPLEASTDAADPRCVGCAGTCDGTACNVDCSKVACPSVKNLCASGIPCTITCSTGGQCSSVACSVSSNSCTVKCTADAACGNVACAADSCEVDCTGTASCGTVTVNSPLGTIDCEGDSACRNTAITCNTGQSCTLKCNPNGGPNDACPASGADKTCAPASLCHGF